MEGLNSNPQEALALGSAEKPNDIRRAVRGLYPQKEIGSIYYSHDQAFRNNPNADWNEIFARIKRENIKPLLDQFTEEVFTEAGDKPLALFTALDYVLATGHVDNSGDVSYVNPEDQSAYKEIYRDKILAAIKNEIGGLSPEEAERKVEKYSDSDSQKILSSIDPNSINWAKDVIGQIQAS